MINKTIPSMSGLSTLDETVLRTKYLIRRAAGSMLQWYGLDTSVIIDESVPLLIPSPENGRRPARLR